MLLMAAFLFSWHCDGMAFNSFHRNPIEVACYYQSSLYYPVWRV